MQSSSSSNEIVYGGTSMMSGSDESHVMSEKVQMIASSIYKEFESMIQKHGQDSIKELMALVVNVLESLDVAYLEKEELAVDLEMLKEENEQLLNQYERERQMRKNQDQKCLEIEETMTEQNRDLESKVESMASIVRMLELRAKNASDHANRLEEREADQKIEYEKLHERYNELLRTHIEHVERTKFLMGAEMFDMAQSLPINNKNNKNSMAMSAIDTNVRGISDLISAVHMSQSTHVDLNLANHISNERDWHEEFGNQQSVAEILANCASPHVENEEDKTATPVEKLEEAHEEENDGKKEDKLVPNDEGDGISLGADLTGQLVDPAEFASAGMGKEVENLIRENTELLETKNALNIVKNDLIARVDQLSSEQEVYREEVRSLELVKLKLSERIREMEAELRELREKVNQADVPEEQEDRSQGKRFTRIEMARMVMEKNQYKEKFLELQETVKYTELKRAKKQEEELAQRRNRSIWGFFSSLLGESTTTPASSARHPPYPQKKGPAGTRKPYNTSPVISKKTRTCDIDMDLMKEKRKAERRQHYQTVSQHMKKEDFPNAYGWSMSSNKAAESMAVPVNCRPLLEQFSSLKIWCAASTALHGGLRNGEYIVGDSLSNCDPHFFRSRRRESRGSSSQWAQSNGVDLLESSLVWVCCLDEQRSVVAVLEASQPTNVLECFEIDAASVLCISTVAGVHEADTRIPPDEGLSPNAELCTKGGYLDAEKIQSAINGSHETFGAVEFIATKKLDDGGGVPTYAPAVEMLSPKRRRDFSTGKSEPSTEGEDIPIHGGLVPPNTNNKTSLRRTTALPLHEQESLAEKEAEKLNENEEGIKDSVKARVDSLPLHIRDSLKLYEDTQEDDIFTVPTMWIGLENYFIHIYSAVQNWRRCLRRVQMPDAVLSILHLNGRVFAALANGAIAVFHRDTDGNWSEKGYHIVRLGAATNSVCHLCVVDGKVWAAYRNCVVVLDPVTLRIDHVIVAHPRKDSQVRQMISCGNGVWLSIRLDSCIRLFHAQTFQHLQDIDVEPFITKMLGTNKLDFLHLRITSLYALDKRIWLGTGSGLILSIPLKEEEGSAAVTDAERGKTPGQAIRVMNSEGGDRMVGEATNVPYCDITNAQLSFHGHKDAVRFLLPVLAEGFSDLTESVETKKVLVISGGDGYIDFRLGEESDALKMQSVDSEAVENMKEQIRARDLTHLLIWETECPMN